MLTYHTTQFVENLFMKYDCYRLDSQEALRQEKYSAEEVELANLQKKLGRWH